MFEYFRGWKRKLGLITLMVAMLFLIEWVRSAYYTDMLMFPSGKTLNRWISDKHGLVWTAHSQTDDELAEQEWDSLLGIPLPAIVFAFPQSLDLDHQKYLSGNEWKTNWIFFGFGFREGKIRGLESTVTVRIFPHWSIGLPLTLFSAYLLVCKSRPKKVAPAA